jgi:hypothetical protein
MNNSYMRISSLGMHKQVVALVRSIIASPSVDYHVRAEKAQLKHG